jgi:hypothetical protein
VTLAIENSFNLFRTGVVCPNSFLVFRESAFKICCYSGIYGIIPALEHINEIHLGKYTLDRLFPIRCLRSNKIDASDDHYLYKNGYQQSFETN